MRKNASLRRGTWLSPKQYISSCVGGIEACPGIHLGCGGCGCAFWDTMRLPICANAAGEVESLESEVLSSTFDRIC